MSVAERGYEGELSQVVQAGAAQEEGKGAEEANLHGAQIADTMLFTVNGSVNETQDTHVWTQQTRCAEGPISYR